jgi:hypothetical protein
MPPQTLPLSAVLVPVQPLREIERPSMEVVAVEVGMKVKTRATSTPSVL